MTGTPRRAATALAAAAMLLGAALLVMASLGVGTRTARAAVALGVANGTVNAAVDHVALGTAVFSNFKSGAIDSYLPLAHAHVDNSPFAEGTASPLDTGPVGQTAAGAASKPQPQYAEARYPKAESTTDTVGSPGGPYAHATAVQGAASSTATYLGGASPAPPGGGGAPPAPQGGAHAAAAFRTAQLSALDAALRDWGARFLGPERALRFPATHPDASEPDGAAGGTVTTSVALDPTSGLLDSGDSRVATASFGGGQVLIRGLHVSVGITNAGTPHATPSVDVGEVTVGGMAVSVGSGGVAVGPGIVPADQLQQANDQLNAALARGGLTIRAVSPVVTTSGNQETILASGLHVDVQQPPTAPGVPQQFADHSLGEVFADSLAVPGAPELGPPPLLPLTPSTTGVTAPEQAPATGSGGTASTPPVALGAPPTSTAPAPRTSTARTPQPVLVTTGAGREKPLWLLLLYFTWQALILGSAVSLWWWRAAARGVG